MSAKTYRGIVKGQTVLLLENPEPLADGTNVLVTPLPSAAGTPAALLAAMEAEPHLSSEDVAELERAIAERRRPRSRVDSFGAGEGALGAD